ncbi:hypothetical protein POSPLADRAFT_1145446 [Postia placenta MAD-698-R-SB12]|uniref:DNA polymerase n=1 Tax=Postia placenta MAD-698-R-SB12 TaxID=670580 RepID=A0A1X6MZ84_9APHY|nr:hypothetical protein POSPLADRAFT_1145446 [Postia placenta MAD-698-R-SB12]OSX61678.1 hypothetical protein POSPLADRAFT_1145446 [Postia placenta MAD-698-R-SB12]
MPFKRPAPYPHRESSSQSHSESSTPYLPPSKHARISTSANSLARVKLYIVQAKFDSSTLSELFLLAEKHAGRLCRDAKDADVIVTAISMRRRFERHIPWELAKAKAVVNPQWLRESAKAGKPLPCGDYAALQDLRTPNTQIDIPSNLLPPDPSFPTDIAKLDYASRYACQRPSPLVCPNQSLAKELDIMRRSRALEGEERSALSYARAISVIKGAHNSRIYGAYPHRITSAHQVSKLPCIGTKIEASVMAYTADRRSQTETILKSERFQALSLFSSIYGIGPTTARKLCSLGLRSLDDLEIYYGVERASQRPSLAQGGDIVESNEGLGDSWIRIALELREDLAIQIPRAEVEEMSRVVMDELDELEPGCVSTIVGGYRRGKSESSDVDIVFTHPDAERVKGLCRRLVRRLHEHGMYNLSGFHGHNPLRNTHWDSLEKALTVFTLPKSSSLHNGIRRRLDLIFAPPEVYWTAVIGWTGSIMFQRDIRQWSKDKLAMKFDSSGITRRYDSKAFYPKTEKEVFDLLRLEWIDPMWRNADV